MNFRDAMEQALGLDDTTDDDVDSVPDALDTLRDEYGGTRGLVEFLRDDLGIPERTAYYYAAGRPIRDPGRRDTIIEVAKDLTAERHDAAIHQATDALRTAGAVTVGRVAVQYDDDDAGTRDVGTVNMADLDTVADLIEQGEWEEAAAEFGEQLMSAYGVDGTLDVSDYPTGIELS